MRRLLFIKQYMTLTLMSCCSLTCFAQISNEAIVAKSKAVGLKYSPKTPVTHTTIAFLKFEESYGIQFTFFTPVKYIPHIFIQSVDSIVLGLANDKRLVLNQFCPYTEYNEIPDFNTFQVSYFIDKAQLYELNKNKVIKIMTSHGITPLTLHIKNDSQNDILNAASSF